MTNPTPLTASGANLKIRFNEFQSSDDAAIEFALEEALLFMSTYSGPARVPMQMYLAAHILAVNAFAADTGGLSIESESIGRISIRYAQMSKTGASQALGDPASTVYGRRYQALQGIGNPKMKALGRSGSSRHWFTNDCW